MHLNATRAAVEEGIVPGGGLCITLKLQVTLKVKGDDQKAGVDIVRRALRSSN